MRKYDKQNAIVVWTIVLCFMLTLGLCHLFSGAGILHVFTKEKNSQTSFAICTGGYTDIALARSSAELIKIRGGAGYVIMGEKIELVFAVYNDNESAKSVLAKLGEKGAYIKEIPMSNGNFKWCKKDNRGAVDTALKYFQLAFDGLYKISNDLTDNTITLVDAKMQIAVLYAQIGDIKSTFYANVANMASDQLTEIKLALVTTLALMDNIIINTNIALSISSIRYQLVQLVMCRQALMNAL